MGELDKNRNEKKNEVNFRVDKRRHSILKYNRIRRLSFFHAIIEYQMEIGMTYFLRWSSPGVRQSAPRVESVILISGRIIRSKLFDASMFFSQKEAVMLITIHQEQKQRRVRSVGSPHR